MNLDKFFTKSYNAKEYNCTHFASDVWFELTGIDLSRFIININDKITDKSFKFEHLDKPMSPCIVIMKRVSFNSHVGIFINNKVFHLTEQGVQYLPLDIASRGFNKLRFIR